MLSLGYFIDTQICIAVLCIFYILILHRRISLVFSRIYLLLAVPVALLIPLFDLPLLPTVKVFLPASTALSNAVPAPQVAAEISTATTAVSYIGLAYACGVVLTALLTLISILRSRLMVKDQTHEYIGGYRVIFGPAVPGAYSVFGTIFVNSRYAGSPWLTHILAHEKSHIRNRHSLDLVWMNLWCIAFWFNPLVWYMLHLLREVHEFEADSEVLADGNNIHQYVELLIDTEAGIYSGIATPLRYSLTKKRMHMMVAPKSRRSLLRTLSVVPVMTVLVGTFSVTARVIVEEYPVYPLAGLALAADISPANGSEERVTAALPQETYAEPAPASSVSQSIIAEIPSATETLPEIELLSSPVSEIEQNHSYSATVDQTGIVDGMMTNFLKHTPQPESFSASVASTPLPASLSRQYPAQQPDNTPENVIYINTSYHENPLEEILPDIVWIRQADRSPLYIVDGVVVNEANRNLYSKLSADDYEHIDILKGRDATKRYGKQARGGAIVVTTKKRD